MVSRYAKFDVNALCQIATKAVHSKICVSIRKLPEGQYNKAFVMIMNDRKRVIAKIPNPNAGRPHYTTASKVATMEVVSTSQDF